MNKNLSIILVITAVSFFGFAGCKPKNETQQESNKSIQSHPDKQAATQIIAYYFHPRFRCPTCTQIQAMAEQAVEENYAQEIAAGRLVWVPINIDEPGNEDFIKTFDLQTSTLVIAEMDSDKLLRSKKLEEVWDLLNNRDEFFEYIKKEIDQYLSN